MISVEKTIPLDGLIFKIDMANYRSYIGQPISNYAIVSGAEVTPTATSGASVTDVTTTASWPLPVPNSKVWRFNLSGTTSNQSCKYTISGNSITGSSGDYWTISYLYRTVDTAGITLFPQPEFWLNDLSRQYTKTMLTSDVSVFVEGYLNPAWYQVKHRIQFTEAYTNATVYPMAFGYAGATSPSGKAGMMYVAGLTISKTQEAISFNDGTRNNTNAVYDLTGNTPVTLNNFIDQFRFDNQLDFRGPGGTGYNQFMSMPNNTIFDSQTISIVAHAYVTSLPQNGFFFEKGAVNTQYSLFLEGSNLIFRLHTGVSYSDLVYNIGTVGAEFHVAGTYVSGSRKIYVNGVVVNSDTLAATISTNANGQSIGAYGGSSGSNSYYFNGRIYEIAVYNRVLTEAEVLNLYTYRQAY